MSEASSDARTSALAVVDELTAACVAILDGALVAVVVHGSLVADDYVPSTSDIDLLVVVDRHLSPPLIDALAEAVSDAAQRRQIWIDFRVVTAGAAREPQRQPALELYVGRHRDVPGQIEIDRGPRVEEDLLFEFSIARAHGQSKFGPMPHELIGPVPADWMLDVGDGYLKRWQEIDYDDRDAELMIFTACRLWQLHDEGRHSSKSGAAAWAMERDPTLTAPKVALERRSGMSFEPLSRDDVMSLLATVRSILASPRIRP